MCVPSGITLGSTATTPQPTGSPLAVRPGQRVGRGRHRQRAPASRSARRGRRGRRRDGRRARDELRRDARRAAWAWASICAICSAFRSRCCLQVGDVGARARPARRPSALRRRLLRADRRREPRGARREGARGRVDPRLRVAELREHVSFTDVTWSRLSSSTSASSSDLAPKMISSALVLAVVEEQPDRATRGAVCETRAPLSATLQLGREPRPARAAARSAWRSSCASRRPRRARLRVERVQAQHGRALARGERRVLGLERCARGAATAAAPHRRRPGARARRGRNGNAEEPPPRRVCLPKHGRNPTSGRPEKLRRAASSRACSTRAQGLLPSVPG